MRKIFTVTIVFALAIAFSSCATRKVSRVNTNEVIDLSGRWNDTDSQLVSAEMIGDLLGARWLPVYESQHNNKRPVVVVGTVTNKSHEHINSETFIVKRDGKKEAFSLDQIKNAISKAFLSVGSFATQDVITNILSRVNISDGTSVEDIQNQVEIALMAEHYYSVAKAFMLYRQKHLEDREVRDKLRFLMDYCDASNPATGSKYDANANVENKNIATLIGELPKSNFIRLNRRLLTDRLKDMYGKELSDRYIELLNQHFIYKNDETNLANYCASITMYPWLISGTASVGGNSTAATNLKSFCGGFINMVFIVSSMLSGACAHRNF